MPYEIESHPRYLLLRFLPVLILDDLMRAATEMTQLEATFIQNKNRVTDLSPLDRIDVGFPEIERVAKQRREVKLPAPIRSVYIAPRPIQFGFARMFQTLNDNPNIQFHIVKTMEEAVAWLESS